MELQTILNFAILFAFVILIFWNKTQQKWNKRQHEWNRLQHDINESFEKRIK